MRKTIYITQARLDLFENIQKTKQLAFYFPHLEMEIIKNQIKDVIYFSYINCNKTIANNELAFQDKIFKSEHVDVFIIILNSIELRKFKRFMDREMVDEKNRDIIYFDFPTDTNVDEKDLYLFQEGKIFLFPKKQTPRPRKKRLTVRFKIDNSMLN